jgi:hypothetical protein
MMGATLAKSPAWAITEEESAKLAAAITQVTQFYEVPMLDEKGRAWLALSMVGFEVYGSRVATAIMEAKARPRTAQGANVTPMRPQAQANTHSPHPNPPGQPITVAESIYEGAHA